MNVKVSEAKGQVLDYLVAQAMGKTIYRSKSGRWMTANYGDFNPRHGAPWFVPSTDWAQGGPIIEREKIGVWWATHYVDDDGVEYGNHWYAEPACTDENADKPYRVAVGPTPLIAAMRCYVVNQLGDEVEVPEDLLTGVNQKGGLVK
jgi:hypothetical protein